MSPAPYAIEAIDARTMSGEEIAGLHALRTVLRREARPDDPPIPLELALARFRTIPEQEELTVWLARDADAVVALGSAKWEPKATDNLHLLQSQIEVHPEHRRRGIATELLAAIVSLADAQQRTLLLGGTEESVPAGDAFCARIGANAGQVMRVSRLLLDELDRSLIETWVAEGPTRAPGYELVFVDGDIPDELMDAAILAFDVMNTAPRDDLDIEDWKVTPAHIRAWERSRAATGGQLWTLFVRHLESNRLVGFTEIGWNPAVPGIIEQMGTAVDPAHRGHALGKWLKAEMLRRLLVDGPLDARELRTGNAESNDAMLGINVALGFRPWLASTAWQLKVEDAKSYLASRTSTTV